MKQKDVRVERWIFYVLFLSRIFQKLSATQSLRMYTWNTIILGNKIPSKYTFGKLVGSKTLNAVGKLQKDASEFHTKNLNTEITQKYKLYHNITWSA